MIDMVTITKKEYFELLEDAETLQQARNHGVDNWAGWLSWVEDDEEEDDD